VQLHSVDLILYSHFHKSLNASWLKNPLFTYRIEKNADTLYVILLSFGNGNFLLKKSQYTLILVPKD